MLFAKLADFSRRLQLREEQFHNERPAFADE